MSNKVEKIANTIIRVYKPITMVICNELINTVILLRQTFYEIV